MLTHILGALVGALVLGCGLYYLVKEKKDKESRKIYGILSAAGGVLLVVMVALMVVKG